MRIIVSNCNIIFQLKTKCILISTSSNNSPQNIIGTKIITRNDIPNLERKEFWCRPMLFIMAWTPKMRVGRCLQTMHKPCAILQAFNCAVIFWNKWFTQRKFSFFPRIFPPEWSIHPVESSTDFITISMTEIRHSYLKIHPLSLKLNPPWRSG